MRQLRSFIWVILMMTGLTAGLAGADEIEGSFWYALDNIRTVESDAEVLIWVAVPPVWHGQEVQITAIEPEPVAVLEDEATGNRVIEWIYHPEPRNDLPEVPGLHHFFHYDFKLTEKPIRFEIDPAQVGEYDRTTAEYQAYSGPETWIQTDGRILDKAREIVGTERHPWHQARLVYTWMLDNMTFVPGGFGDLDARATLVSGKGNCGQYSRLFCALVRSIGIPARTVATEYMDGGSHVFAEFQLPGYGWVPADPSLGQMLMPGGAGFTPEEVAGFMAKRNIPLGDPQFLLGNLYDQRLAFVVGNNITVQSPTLNQQITFQEMRPGGQKAHPTGIRIEGLNRSLIHGGFFVFGEKLADDEAAHQATHQRLANAFFNVGLYDVVEDGCRSSLNQYSDGVQPWINMGKVYMHKGEYYKAEAAFKRAMSGDVALRRDRLESLIWTHNYLGNCYDLLGHRDLALAEYEKVVKLDNNYRGAVDYAQKYIKRPFSQEAPE